MTATSAFSWPEVRIGNVLSYTEELIKLDDLREYITITVKRRHGGLEARDRLLGHQIKTEKQYRLIPGAFLISRIQCWHQAYAIVPSDTPRNMIASTNYDQFIISPNVDNRFLWWFSHSPLFTETVRSSAFGVVIEKMVFDRNAWLEKTIPLPPLDEQRRIVCRIEELTTRVREATDLRRRALAESALTLEATLTSLFDRLQSSYPSQRLGGFCAVVRGGSPRPAGSPVYYGGSIPFLKVADLTANEDKYLKTHTFTIKEAGLSHTRYVGPNTLMLTNSGATLGVPKICLFPTAFNDGIQAFLDIKDGVSQEYLYYFLKSRTRRFRDTVARGQGQPNLNTDMTKELLLPVPEKSAQYRIVSDLDELKLKFDTLRTLQSETAAELDALVPSILSRAFRGEL